MIDSDSQTGQTLGSRGHVLHGGGVGSALLKGVLEGANTSRVCVQPFMVRGMARTVVGRQVQPFMGLLYLVLFRQ